MHDDVGCLVLFRVEPPDCCETDVFPCIFIISNFFNVAHEERRDPSLRTLIESPDSANQNSSLRVFIFRESTLYSHNIHSDRPALLLVQSQRLCSGVWKEIYDLPAAGYLGVSYTYGLVRRRFFSARLCCAERGYVASCDLCECSKTAFASPAGGLHCTQTPPNNYIA